MTESMITWMGPHLPFLGLSRSPGSASSSLQHDLDLIKKADVVRIICLQEAFELDLLDESIGSRRQEVESRDILFTHEPIEDYDAPTPAQMTRLLELVTHHSKRSQKVLVHCQAGLGRAGTVAACALLREGFKPQGSIAMVRYMRLGAIQSKAQEDFITHFHSLL